MSRVETPYNNRKIKNLSIENVVQRKGGLNGKSPTVKNYVSIFGNEITKQKKKDKPFEVFEVEEEIINIEQGDGHIFLFTKNGSIFGLGDNSFGQLGLNPEFSNVQVPQKLILVEKLQVYSLYTGSDHCFAITQRNDVYSWGLNAKGQLGLNHYDNVFCPEKVKSISLNGNELDTKFSPSILNSNEAVVDISCGGLHTIILTSLNRVFSCGFGGSYALGHGNKKTINYFKEIKYFSDFQNKIEKIKAGVSHSGCLINGQLYLWGSLGSSKYLVYQKPNTIVLNKEIINFELGDFLTVVLTSSKEVYTMGENIDFQLGHRKNNSLTPIKVNFPRKIESIGCGVNHVIVITKSRVFGWGSNRFGQLNPFSNEKYFEDLVELNWIREAFALLIKCGSLQTLVVTQKEMVNNIEDEEQKIQELQIMIENFKRKSEQLKDENVKMTEKMDELYNTLNQISIDQQEIEPNTTKKNYDNNIMEKFKAELKKNRTVMPSYEINFSEIRFGNKISEGSYGIVYKGKWKELKVAIKTLKKEHHKENTIKDFLNEVSALQCLRHPNIVMCMGASTKSPSTLALVLEYCPNDSLWNLLHKHDLELKWKKRYEIALGIARGMNYLHSFPIPIIHRDLKSLNILFDAHLNPKISDFGWTRLMAEKMTGKIGTFQWMAPEVISTKYYSEKADVYSFGIILWEIASRLPPYPDKMGTQVIQEVVNNVRPVIPNDCPKQFAKLMKSCWAQDPNLRPSFKEIVHELKSLKVKTLD
jgi:alpha-tubulin suppressor-like RCC1 family protein